MALLTLNEISHAFGGPKLFDRLSLQIERGDRICLLGRNGEGKSTLLKVISGSLVPDEGEIIKAPSLEIARLPQDAPEGLELTVAELTAVGLGEGAAPAGPDDHRVAAILSRVGLDPEMPFASLSAGLKRRALLAQALVSEPELLLLDEPTNHLDIDAIAWLEEFLLRSTCALVIVTHDRAFLSRLANRIIELDRGAILDWRCDYPNFLERKAQRLAAEERQNALFDKRLAQEEVWIRKGIEARRTRNEGRVRALKAMRVARAQRRERQGSARIELQEAERSGMLVAEAKDISFAYGATPIVSGLTTTITRGDRIGIIGPNGSGKSTLLKLLLGELAPSGGSVKHGTNLKVAYFDQLKETLDDERTVQQNVSEYETIVVNGQSRHVIGYLSDFLFPPERSRTLVKFLSGGERSRLLLAKLFTRPANVLALDEPTNDLDIETLELLENLLAEFDGTVLLVSHDRAFLNGVATAALVLDGDGRVREYDGGYDDYLTRKTLEDAEAERLRRSEEEKPRQLASPGPAPAANRPRKLGNKERRELVEIPERIERLEAERERLHEKLADPAFYRREGAEVAAAKSELDALESELAGAYARWEALEAQAHAAS